jgi:hypothetical protein
MATMAFIAFTFCLLIGIRNTLRTAASIRWIEEGNRPPSGDGSCVLKFVILLPLLREQKVIKKLMTRMASLDLSVVTDVSFVFITTSREGIGGGTSASMLEALLREQPNPRFIHLHCTTGADQYKSDQVNYALQRLGLMGQRDEHVYIGVYDADSSPDPRTLTFIAQAAGRNTNLKAIQQVPFYFQNVRNPKNVRELYVMTRPVHNLLFALTIEVPCMRRQTDLFSRSRTSIKRIANGWLSHALGHGQFFRLDTLTDHGGFQPPSCDTQFGHALAFCGVPIQPHPMLDVGQTPESVGVLMRQGIVWFNSMNTFWRTKQMVSRLGAPNYSLAGAWAMMARLVHSNLAWAVYPILFLAALIWSIASSHYLLMSYGLLAWGVYLVPVALILAHFKLWAGLCSEFEPIRSLSLSTKAGMLLMFGVEKLGSCISPFLWFFYALRRLLRGTSIELRKTEREEA